MTRHRLALLAAAALSFTGTCAEQARAMGDDEAEARDEEAPAAAEQPRAPAFARVWLGFAGALDVLSMPSGSDLCRLSESGAPANDLGVYCTNPDGSDFPTRQSRAENDALAPGASGAIDGGLTTGNLRVLFSADYAASSSLLVGTRIGYAFGGFPGAAAGKGFPWIDRNLHAELRATYIFGSDPLTRIGFVPMAFLAGGAGEFDAQLTRYATMTATGRRPVNIWIVRGPWFVTAGAGIRYQFSPRVAFNAALRLNAVFGSPSMLLTAGPDIGLSYGF